MASVQSEGVVEITTVAQLVINKPRQSPRSRVFFFLFVVYSDPKHLRYLGRECNHRHSLSHNFFMNSRQS